MKVDSQPRGAEVYQQSNKKLKKLGVTPMDLKSDQFDGDSIHLVIQKEGYKPQSVLFEKRTLSSKGEIFTQLTEGSKDRGIASINHSEMNQKVERVGRSIANIQSHLLKRNFQSAENMAQSLVTEFPYFAVGWNLLGNAYYLQNRHTEALEAYYKAAEYDPDNLETQTLINRIENKPPRSDR
ncbi:MAG: tetratricopeptide repeat protein [Bdellovibrionales bacterium]|nr:tetratricopeptide repeat protein [Bdellovibrionales bacterium]